MGTGAYAASPDDSPEYKSGYLCGLIRGDGHIGSYSYERAGPIARRCPHVPIGLDRHRSSTPGSQLSGRHFNRHARVRVSRGGWRTAADQRHPHLLARQRGDHTASHPLGPDPRARMVQGLSCRDLRCRGQLQPGRPHRKHRPGDHRLDRPTACGAWASGTGSRRRIVRTACRSSVFSADWPPRSVSSTRSTQSSPASARSRVPPSNALRRCGWPRSSRLASLSSSSTSPRARAISWPTAWSATTASLAPPTPTSTSTPARTSSARSSSRSTRPSCCGPSCRSPSWKHEHVALGTNTDPYQWVESRYKLMPGIWEALRDSGTPVLAASRSRRWCCATSTILRRARTSARR